MKLLGHYVLPLEITRELQVRVTRSAIKPMYWYFAYRKEEGCSFNISLIRRDVDGDKAEVHRGRSIFSQNRPGGVASTSDGISALKCTQHYHQAPSHKILNLRPDFEIFEMFEIFEIKTRFCCCCFVVLLFVAVHFVLCFQIYILIIFVRIMFLQCVSSNSIIRCASISWFQVVSQSASE